MANTASPPPDGAVAAPTNERAVLRVGPFDHVLATGSYICVMLYEAGLPGWGLSALDPARLNGFPPPMTQNLPPDTAPAGALVAVPIGGPEVQELPAMP